MSKDTNSRIEDIRSMMESGHRSIKLERHTLIVWGIAAAFLILIIPILFAPEHFELRWHRMVAQNIFTIIILSFAGIVDYKLTKKIRSQRDESISFVQRQLIKVWWLLVGLIVVINIGMNFFGGGYIFLSITLLIAGVALYIQGLFSQQMLCWLGLMMILVGLLSVALKIPHPQMQWVAASVYGLGFPAMAWLLSVFSDNWSISRRIAIIALWLGIVIAPASLAYQLTKNNVTPDLPSVSLQDYMNSTSSNSNKPQVVRLPSGTRVPINIEISGDSIKGETRGELVLQLAEDLELIVENDKPKDRFRVGDGLWKRSVYNFRLRDMERDVKITRENGPQINFKMRISTTN